nr:aminopeptidase P family protein [Roseospira visakhapatnamensis]
METEVEAALDALWSRLPRGGEQGGRNKDDLRALMAGLAAAPAGVDDAWMELVTPGPRDPDLDGIVRAARRAMAARLATATQDPVDGRLKRLRRALDGMGMHGLLVPRADAHQGEFVAGDAERLAWLTGFTGSAGLAVVLRDQAAVFVDGRYTLQAADQVDTGRWSVVPLARTSVGEWLGSALRAGDRLGFDPWLHTPAEVERHGTVCARAGARLEPLAVNPIDTLWRARPPAPLGPVVPHPLEMAGRPSADKRAEIAGLLRQKGMAATVITDPAALAWLLNIRGADVPFSPVPLGFAILRDSGRVDLFLEARKMTAAARASLDPDVTLREPGALGAALDALGAKKRSVLLDKDGCAQWINLRLTAAGARVRLDDDPIARPKARKTVAELDGARAAHRRDGVAMVRFLCWLDAEGPAGRQTERSAAAHLRDLRAEGARYRGPSFETISGAGPHGAVVHYRVTAETDRRIEPDMLYLVDSGAQYQDGTTDVTRTVAVGAPTAEQARRFTQVLKGHIAIATAVFPRGTTGTQLDTLARLALWADGVDFEHGTGHGVGSHLGVHEGPQRISKRPSTVALEPGMIVSNEPGYYKTGAFGIRIETLVVVTPVPTPDQGEHPLLGFETLTLAPIDRRLIDPALLTGAERDWVDAYHARVRAEIGPLVDDPTRAWLTEATAPLDGGPAAG